MIKYIIAIVVGIYLSPYLKPKNAFVKLLLTWIEWGVYNVQSKV